MSHTYGLEFEVIDLTPRQAASAVTRSGITCQEQSYNHATTNVWKALRDGSLPDGSAEIVSPILTDDSLNEARTVARALQGAGARVTQAAGFHVHMGYDRIGKDALAQLVVNYYAVHHATAKLVAPSRLNSRWAHTVDSIRAERIADAIRNETLNWDSQDRYYSLNLNSIARHGTIEFRLHQGTLNPTKALAWVNYLTAFVNLSADGEHVEHEMHWDAMPCLERLTLRLMNYGLTERNRNYLLQRAEDIAGRQA
jgi:hypothetical protein